MRRGLRCAAMGDLDGYEKDTFTFDGKTRDVFRKGAGPAVMVIAEMPGITPKVLDFADRVVGARLHRRAAAPVRRARRGGRRRGKAIRAIGAGLRVEGVLGLGDRQDQPGGRVVEGARPPRARALRRPRRRGRGHVLHRQLRPRHAARAGRAGAGAVASRRCRSGSRRRRRRGPLHERRRPRQGAGPPGRRARPVRARAAVHRRPAGARPSASPTCARRSATASSASRSTRRRATRTATRGRPLGAHRAPGRRARPAHPRRARAGARPVPLAPARQAEGAAEREGVLPGAEVLLGLGHRGHPEVGALAGEVGDGVVRPASWRRRRRGRRRRGAARRWRGSRGRPPRRPGRGRRAPGR